MTRTVSTNTNFVDYPLFISQFCFYTSVFTFDLEEPPSNEPIDAATGVLQITIESARYLKGHNSAGGTLNPYVLISLNGGAEIARTEHRRRSYVFSFWCRTPTRSNMSNPLAHRYNPHFGSVHTVISNDFIMMGSLTLTVMDYNDRRKDTLIGSMSFELSLLIQDDTRKGIVSTILREGKCCGELVYSV